MTSSAATVGDIFKKNCSVFYPSSPPGIPEEMNVALKIYKLYIY